MSDTPQYDELDARRRLGALAAARSQYGQVRLTVTFEPRGRMSYRLMAKKPQDAWTEVACVAQGTYMLPGYPPDFDEALLTLAQVAARLAGSDELPL